MENVPVRGLGGRWEYPRSDKVLKECGLREIEVYVRRRRATIAEHIACRPIFAECEKGERKRGSPRHSFWWEQELTLDEDALTSGYSSDGSNSSQSSSSFAGDVSDG